MNSLRLGSTGGTRLGFALGRFGGAAHGWRRSVSATSSAAAPVPGDQGVGMDPAKQQQPPPHAPEGKQQDKIRDDKHTARGDVMTDSFGEGYSTRADEEGFGGVYGQNDPEHDSQGSEAKEKDNNKRST